MGAKTENVSAATATARGNSQTVGGRFGTHPRSKAKIKLVPDTHFSHEHMVTTGLAAADAELANKQAEA